MRVRPRDQQDERLRSVSPSAVGLRGWIRAWRQVMRDPDKQIPEPGLPPEGEPIPAALDLHCPECGYSIGGLREWTCPACGQHFSPRRAHTIKMLKRPEYFLRYRFAPEDIRTILWTIVLLTAGAALITGAGVSYAVATSGPGGAWVAPLVIILNGMTWMVGLPVPSLIVIKFLLDLPWFRVAYYYSIIWFVSGLLLFALAVL